MSIRRLILIIFLFCGINASLALSLPVDSLTVISGFVKDSAHKKKLAGTTVSVPGSNIGTVTNDDGFFSIKAPKTLLGNGIKAEHLGFLSNTLAGSKLKGGNVALTIWLDPITKQLREVTVYGAEPRSLVESALRKIPQNYPASQNMFSSFYRETIQKGKRYIGVSEAIMKVLKKSYKARHTLGERVQLVKGRRLVSQRSSDTLSVKIAGGSTLPIILDVVKNEDVLFSLPELDYYEFKMEDPVSIDERQQFVVSFQPKVTVDYALNKGKIYIDQENLSFTRLEFSLDMSDKDKATRAILYKKPRGLRFNPQEVDFVVTYKYHDGVSYLNYIRMKTRFKCDWKRRLFSSGYTTYAEMVMVDREDNPSEGIPCSDAFGKREIFYDKLDDFSDDDFWKDYNIIEPTESLEKAIEKLRK